MIKLVLLLILAVFALLYFLLPQRRQAPKYYKKQKLLVIGNLEIERCDLDHYNVINDNFNRQRNWYEPVREIQHIEEIDIPEQYLYDEDSQNVHDTLVVNSSKNTYANLTKAVVDDEFFLEQFQSPHKETLLKIKERNSFIRNLGKHEWDIVKDVWNDGYSKPNVRAQYLKELEDCINTKDHLYCATGVVNRILSAVHIDEPEKMPKTKDIFKVEILSRFSALMQDNPKEICKEIVIKEYTDLLTEDKLNEIIDEWYEFI